MKICKLFLLILTFVLLSLSACGPAKMNATWSNPNYEDKSYSKIAVVGIGKDIDARTSFENTAVQLLKEKGINAVEGITVFPPTGLEEAYTAEDYIRIITQFNLDGIITMALVDTAESKQYTQGEIYTIPRYYRVGKYLVRSNLAVRGAGYYTTSKSYLIEAILYNLKGELKEGKETIVWTGQSTLINPSSLSTAAKSFTKRLVNELINERVINTE